MPYLLIENPGLAPLEGLTLFGATSKDSSDLSQIGMFGSGTKHAVLVLLRKGLAPIIYSGTDRLEYSTRPLVGYSDPEVFYSVNGAAPRTSGSTLAYGRSDWGEHLNLALREFVSNALDAVNGQPELISFSLAEKPRAKAGVTRVFIPWPDDLSIFQRFLRRYFLHFRPSAQPFVGGPIPKVEPNTPACFYRRGVLINQWHDPKKISLWDYNFVHLTLDEARNSDSWRMQAEATGLLAENPKALAQTIVELNSSSIWWESDLNQYTLQNRLAEPKQLAEELELQLGPKAVLVSNPIAYDTAKSRGLVPISIPAAVLSGLTHPDLPTASARLSADDLMGRTVTDARPSLIARVMRWVKVLETSNLTADRSAPSIHEFTQHPNSPEGVIKGYCTSAGAGAGIYFNSVFVSDSPTSDLDITILEELTHWYSGQADFTRGFQEFLLRLVQWTLSEASDGGRR